MEIVKKITCLLWLLAVLLVAPPVLRSFGIKPKDVVKALFAEEPVTQKEPPVSQPPAPSQDDQRGKAREQRPDISVPPPPAAETAVPYSPEEEKEFNALISGLENVDLINPKDNLDTLPSQVYRPADSAHKVRWMPPPPGFLTADTFNYLIYRENNPVTENIKTVLDNIHGNLMLDLTPFTIVIKPNKILVMLFGEKDSYMTFTKRPAWSGASSDLRADTMYIIEGNSFYPLSVHELTHLYFDGYFLPTISPLWLSEGMAVYMQIHTTKQKPSWVDRSLRRILAGDIISFDEMTVTEDLSAYSTEQAELWYTQAYSLVDYMLNTRTRDEFYKLCNEIKAKTPLHQALYRAYGMPFNKVSVLENVWLHDLQKAYKEGKILQTPPPSALPKQAKKAPAAPKASAPAEPKADEQQAPAPKKPQPKPAPQKTKINKLKMVPTNGYKGGFS